MRSRGGRSEAEEAINLSGIGVANPLLVNQNVSIAYPDMNFKKVIPGRAYVPIAHASIHARTW